MKPEKLAALFIFLVLTGCGSSTTKNETHSDSATVKPVSTTATSSPSSPAPIEHGTK